MRYVLPLLPTIMCWWLTTSSDRFFIQHYFSLSDNGIYAVAARFGAIMQIVGAIIFQAWQEMALRQYNSPDRDKFFSEMVNLFIMFMSIAALCFAFGLKIVYPFIVSPEYVAGIVYVFPIIASSVLYALSNILEVGYQCSFETGRALLGVGVSAAVNILLNFVLIQTIGIYGVMVTSVVTYAVLLGFRIHDSRRYFKTNISKMSILTVAIGAVGVFPFYFTDSVLVDVVMIMIGLAAMTLVAPRVLRSLRQSKRGS